MGELNSEPHVHCAWAVATMGELNSEPHVHCVVESVDYHRLPISVVHREGHE